jgi:serine/threonine protein kinase
VRRPSGLRLAQALCSLASRCLTKDANARPTASGLLKDPLFRHVHDRRWLARRLLQPPAERGAKRVSFNDAGSDSPTSSLHPLPVRPGRRIPRVYPLVPVPFCLSKTQCLHVFGVLHCSSPPLPCHHSRSLAVGIAI